MLAHFAEALALCLNELETSLKTAVQSKKVSLHILTLNKLKLSLIEYKAVQLSQLC